MSIIEITPRVARVEIIADDGTVLSIISGSPCRHDVADRLRYHSRADHAVHVDRYGVRRHIASRDRIVGIPLTADQEAVQEQVSRLREQADMIRAQSAPSGLGILAVDAWYDVQEARAGSLDRRADDLSVEHRLA